MEERKWKNWEGRKVWTVSVDDVRWVEYEHYPDAPKGKPKRFKLYPQEFSVNINFPLDITNGIRISIGNASVTQIPVNSNIATTGHKLQGMSYSDCEQLGLQMCKLGLRCPVESTNKKGSLPHEVIRHGKRLQRTTETA